LEYEKIDLLKKLFDNRTEFGKIANLIKQFFYQKDTLNSEIIERKRIEAEIRKYANELKEINIGKDKLFSIIAHDLKSPFIGLLGLTEILSEDYDQLTEEEKKKFIGMIKSDSREIYRLIINLLDWSRLQTDRMEFKSVEYNYKTQVEGIISLFKSTALKKNIEIQNLITEETVVFADKTMVHSVTQNLLSNALKFTPINGSIKIGCKKYDNQLEIMIKDNGVGISKENLEKIFRLDSNLTTKGTEGEKGTGLGLLICKEMIEKNNGKIWIESEVGKGTTFHFTLPTIEKIDSGINISS
jgi:signal transduction histidine kinase